MSAIIKLCSLALHAAGNSEQTEVDAEALRKQAVAAKTEHDALREVEKAAREMVEVRRAPQLLALKHALAALDAVRGGR
jgi:hypothetical protein